MISIPIILYEGENYNPPPISVVDDCFPPIPIPLIDYTAIMTVRQAAQNSNIVLQATTENGYIVILETAGQILINIPAELIAPLAPFNGSWDLFIYSPSGNSTRILGGIFNVLQSDTQ